MVGFAIQPEGSRSIRCCFPLDSSRGDLFSEHRPFWSFLPLKFSDGSICRLTEQQQLKAKLGHTRRKETHDDPGTACNQPQEWDRRLAEFPNSVREDF